MVAGHLQEKNGIYYVVLTYKLMTANAKPNGNPRACPSRATSGAPRR